MFFSPAIITNQPKWEFQFFCEELHSREELIKLVSEAYKYVTVEMGEVPSLGRITRAMQHYFSEFSVQRYVLKRELDTVGNEFQLGYPLYVLEQWDSWGKDNHSLVEFSEIFIANQKLTSQNETFFKWFTHDVAQLLNTHKLYFHNFVDNYEFNKYALSKEDSHYTKDQAVYDFKINSPITEVW